MEEKEEKVLQAKIEPQNAMYELTAVKPEQYPQNSIPEIALLGRSNVGKSTFLNTLLRRKNLARVSSAPGKTRGINFYNIDGVFYLVDLPGYGYAKVSKKEKESWGRMIEGYLNHRQQLTAVIMLTDIRHSPSADDKIMYNWIRKRSIPHLILATKSDKISRGKIRERLRDIGKSLSIADDLIVIPYSSVTKQGINEIWTEILNQLGYEKVTG